MSAAPLVSDAPISRSTATRSSGGGDHDRVAPGGRGEIGRPLDPERSGHGIGAVGVDVEDHRQLGPRARGDHASVVGTHVAGADHGDPR